MATSKKQNSYQEMENRLNEIIKILSNNEVGLDEQIVLYKEAKTLMKTMKEKLDELSSSIEEDNE